MKNKELLELSLKHQKFYMMQVEFLYNAIDEISILGDSLSKKIAENIKERHQLDKLIFAKTLFNK